MKVFRADTGEVYDVSGSSDTTVASVKHELASLAGVEAGDQMLLFQDVKLEDARTLASYNLPSEDSPVFLFNLQPGAPPPKATVLEPADKPIPQRLQPKQPKHATGPEGALLRYQSQFLSDFDFAKRILEEVDSRIALSRRCCAEQEMQSKALKSAIAYLWKCFQDLIGWEDLQKSYLGYKPKFEDILRSFESDVTRLREVTLHPALRDGRVQTLLDVVIESRLRTWAEECKNNNEQMGRRLAHVGRQIMDVRQDIDGLSESWKSLYARLAALKEDLKNTGPMRQVVESTKATFSQNYKNVTAQLEDLRRDGRGEGSWEVCDGFESMKTAHVHQVAKLTKFNSAIAEVLTRCAQAKTETSTDVYTKLQIVFALDKRMLSLCQELRALRTIFVQVRKAFAQLGYVRDLPNVYWATLDEVVRRKILGKRFVAFFSQFCRQLSKICEDESKQRSMFMKEYGHRIPSQLFPGMRDTLPDFGSALAQWLPPLDEALPPIEPPPDAYVPPLSLGSLDNASPPKSLTSPRTSANLSGRTNALEAENARLLAEVQSLKREAREKERRRVMEKERSDDAISPYRSPSSSEGSYVNRIQSLEDTLSETYKQLSATTQDLEASKKRGETMKGEIETLRETLARTEKRLNEVLAARKPAGVQSGSGGSIADVGSGGGVADLDGDAKELQSLRKERELLIADLQQTQGMLMEEQSKHKRKDEELEAANRDNAQLRDRVRVLERHKVSLEEDLIATKDELSRAQAALEESEATGRDLGQRLERAEAEKEALLEEQKKAEQTIEEQSQQLAKFRNKTRAERKAEKKAAMVLAEYDKDKLRSPSMSAALSASDLTSPSSSLTTGLSEIVSPTSSSTFAPGRPGVPLTRERSGPLGDERLRNELLAEASRTSQLAEEEAASMERSIGQLEERYRSLKPFLPEEKKKEKQEKKKEKEKQEKEKEKQVQAAAEEIARLQSALAKTEEELHARENEIAELKQQLDSERQHHQTIAAQHETLKREMRDREEGATDELNRRMAELYEQLDLKDGKITELSTRNAAREQEVATLGRERDELKAKLEEEIAELRRQLDDERQQYQTILAQHGALEKEMREREEGATTELGQRMAELYGQLDLKESKITELTNRNAAKEQEVATLERKREKLKAKLEQMTKELDEARNAERTEQMLREESDQSKKALEEKVSQLTASLQRRLALDDFKVDDIACFMYNPASGCYEAFNIGAPHYYLSEESLQMFDQAKRRKERIMGQIVFVAESTATAADNPYRLPVGTRYYDVTITQSGGS